VPDFNNTGVRVPYYVSVLYWLGLIAVIYITLVLVYRKRRKDEERVR
jgi:hypothetical protein